MPDYEFVALQSSGQQVTGVQSGASEQEVLLSLTSRDLYPVRIQPAGQPGARRGRRVRKRHIAVFYSQLSDLLRSGVPLLRTLDLLQRRTSQQSLKLVIQDVRDRVADGAPLAEAMHYHPRVFNELAVSMVRAGEEGSFLEDVLKRIAAFSDRQEQLKSQVIGALAYPVFLMTMGTIIVTSIMVFFVPKFAPIFERISSRGELPWATTALMSLSSFLHDYGIVLLVFLAVAVFAAVRHFRTEKGRLRFDRARLSVYGAGPILQGLAIARFCRILGTLLHNGVPILRSLRIARDASGSRVLSEAIAAASENIASGRSLTEPLRASGQFPEEIVEMIAVGADANNLEQVLIDIADGLERDTQRRLDLYVRLLEPAMLLVIAALILFVVVGLLLPILKSSSILV